MTSPMAKIRPMMAAGSASQLRAAEVLLPARPGQPPAPRGLGDPGRPLRGYECLGGPGVETLNVLGLYEGRAAEDVGGQRVTRQAGATRDRPDRASPRKTKKSGDFPASPVPRRPGCRG
jgi:hypothetical protein